MFFHMAFALQNQYISNFHGGAVSMGSNQKKDPSGVTCSAGELAKLFGIQPRAIQALAAKGAIIRATHGRYLRDASILAYVTHLRESAAGRLAREGGEDVLSASAGLKLEQTMLARARRRILENEVIDVERLQPIWTRHARVVRASVMAVPSRCRAALPHLSAFDQNKIDELCRDALTDLAQKAPQIEAQLGEAFVDDDDDGNLRQAKRAKR
jgi:terminase small subunit / prophage DNA-packing protein